MANPLNTSTLQAFYCAESDKVRSANASASAGSKSVGSVSGKMRFKQLVQTAMGSVKINKSGDELFFTAPDCIKVRRRLKVSGFVDLSEERESIFKRCIEPTISKAFHEKRDLVIVAGGNQGTSKSQFFHGDTLDAKDGGDQVPDRSTWGMAYLAVEKLLKVSQHEQCEITATVTKIHLDHVADMLVSLSGLRLTKKDAQKTRQQYAKLLALSQGVTLDVEESMDGRFAVADQLDCPIRSTEDFLHVVNCCAAANAGKFVLKLGPKRASPQHYIISLRVWRKEQAPTYLHLYEMADFDWTGSEEDTALFKSVLQSVADLGSAFDRRDTLKIKAKVRENTLTRILHSSLNYNATDIMFFGMAKFNHGQEMLEYMSRMNNHPIEIVLHGPDGEGDNDVDPELKEHVQSIQEQCEVLKENVASLSEETKQLEEKLKHGEESISRLQQQCSIVRKLASMSSQPKEKDHSSGSRPPSVQTPSLTAAQEQRRRLLALERDLAELKAEDKRRTESCMAQIRHITSEKNRCSTRTQALRKEHQQLSNQLKQLERSIQEEHKRREQEMDSKIQSVIDQNHREIEAKNNEARRVMETTQLMASKKEEREAIREQEIARALQEAATALSDSIAAENAKWSAEHKELERQLEEATQQRLALEEELLGVKRNHHLAVAQLDEESKELTEYAHRITKALVQFEHYNSTEAKKVINFPKCNVVLYDTTAEHSIAWFQKHCSEMRAWLDERGFPAPAAYVDLQKDCVVLLDEENAARAKQKDASGAPVKRPTTAGPRGRPQSAAPTKSVSPPEAKSSQQDKPKPDSTPKGTIVGTDYSQKMYEDLQRRNADLEIVIKSRERLAQIEEAKKKKAVRPPSASTGGKSLGSRPVSAATRR